MTWIASRYGFFSVVCARKGSGAHAQPVDPDRLMIRARDPRHLLNLQEAFADQLGGFEILRTNADYPARFIVPKVVFAEVARKLVMDIGYDNFKSEVYKREGSTEYEGALHRVWSVFRGIEPKDARGS